MRKAFTLIELLIVIAIIAILALIAVPNFLEAQTRAKVARIMADMRSVATALESYMMDNGAYPIDADGRGDLGFRGGDESQTWRMLTTPMAYITSMPVDIFNPGSRGTGQGYKQTPYYEYWGYDAVSRNNPSLGATWARNSLMYFMNSVGPDQDNDNLAAFTDIYNRSYDPTNGTVSNGDIGWSNLGAFPGGFRP